MYAVRAVCRWFARRWRVLDVAWCSDACTTHTWQPAFSFRSVLVSLTSQLYRSHRHEQSCQQALLYSGTVTNNFRAQRQQIFLAYIFSSYSTTQTTGGNSQSHILSHAFVVASQHRALFVVCFFRFVVVTQSCWRTYIAINGCVRSCISYLKLFSRHREFSAFSRAWKYYPKDIVCDRWEIYKQTYIRHYNWQRGTLGDVCNR